MSGATFILLFSAGGTSSAALDEPYELITVVPSPPDPALFIAPPWSDEIVPKPFDEGATPLAVLEALSQPYFSVPTPEDTPFLYGYEDPGIVQVWNHEPPVVVGFVEQPDDTPFLYGYEDPGVVQTGRHEDVLITGAPGGEDYPGPPLRALEIQEAPTPFADTNVPIVVGIVEEPEDTPFLYGYEDVGAVDTPPPDDPAPQQAPGGEDFPGTKPFEDVGWPPGPAPLDRTDGSAPIPAEEIVHTPAAFGFDEAVSLGRFEPPPDANAGVVPEEMAFPAFQIHVDEPSRPPSLPPDISTSLAAQGLEEYAPALAAEEPGALQTTPVPPEPPTGQPSITDDAIFRALQEDAGAPIFPPDVAPSPLALLAQVDERVPIPAVVQEEPGLAVLSDATPQTRPILLWQDEIVVVPLGTFDEPEQEQVWVHPPDLARLVWPVDEDFVTLPLPPTVLRPFIWWYT